MIANFHRLTTLSLLTAFHFTHAWLIPCGQDGTVDCSEQSQPLPAATNLTHQSLSVNDCIYIACPTLNLLDCAASFRNVTFKQSKNGNSNSNGGAIHAEGSSINIIDCKFINCVAANGGGAIHLSKKSNSTAENLSFLGNSAGVAGGDLKIDDGSSFYCRNCRFDGSRSGQFGGAIFVESQSHVTISGGWLRGTSAGRWGGCFYVALDSLLEVSDMNVDGAFADVGGFLFLNIGANASITNVTVRSVHATGMAGCFYQWSKCYLSIHDSTFYGCASIGAFGGLAVLEDQSTFSFLNSKAFDSSGPERAGFIYARGSVVSLRGSLLSNGKSLSGGAISILGPNSFLFCDDETTISNCRAKKFGGAIQLNDASTASIGNCLISSNLAGFDGGAFSLSEDATLHLGLNSRVLQNSAGKNGGAVALSGSSSLYVEGNALLQNNTATACGGAIHMQDEHTTVVLNSTDIVVANNIAFQGTFLSMQGTNTTTVSIDKGTVRGSIRGIIGTLWVEDAWTAVALIDNNVTLFLPSVTPQGRAVTLTMLNGSIDNLTLNIKQPLPTIIVSALDAFGRLAQPSRITPVIVTLSAPDGQNVSVLGERAKPIFDLENSGQVSFTGIHLEGPPAKYVLELHAISGTSAHIDLAQYAWPRFVVHISECKRGQELFVTETSSCLPIRITGSLIRVSFGILAAILVIFCLLIALSLFRHRATAIVKANSWTFLVLCTLGSCIGIASLIVSIADQSWMCLARQWLEQLGFAFVFAALMLKTYRIQRIFSVRNADPEFIKLLRDTNLLKIFAFICMLMIAFLVAWSVMDPPYPKPSAILNSYITTDRCSTSIFSSAITIVRLLTQFVAVWLAFSIRKVHAAFNESHFIGFAAYNWVIFGALLQILVITVISDPSIAYVLEAISIVVPHATTAVLLGGIKAFYCIFKPAKASEGGKRIGAAATKRQFGSTSTGTALSTIKSEGTDVIAADS